MSTRRAKQHKRDVFFKVRARRLWKKFDLEGLFHKDIRQLADRQRKFRKRAYHRAKEIENKSLKTEPPGLLQFVTHRLVGNHYQQRRTNNEPKTN